MKNICIGLFEGETLPESLAAFKDVKLDLEFGKVTTIYTLHQLDCEKVVVVGLGDGKKNIKEAFSKVEADDYLVYVTENTAYAAGFGLVYGAYSYKETKVYDLESDGFKDEFEKGIHSMHLLLIILAMCVEDARNYDYRLPYPRQFARTGKLDNIMNYRSISGAMSYKEQNKIFLNPINYLVHRRPGHIYDSIVMGYLCKLIYTLMALW